MRQKNRASQQQAQLALLSDTKFQGVKAFSRLKAIKTKMQTSEAFAFWEGRAVECTSFRIYAEARDMELARTKLFFLHTFSGAAEKVCRRRLQQ